MKLPNKIKPFLITLSLCCAAPLLQPLSAAPEPAAKPAADDSYTVEKIKKTRVKHGVVQYLVKWAGYINKHNTWLDIDEMECDDLIAEFIQFE